MPLSVAGRINLLKMVLMPQLMFYLHNLPCWISLIYFKEFTMIFRNLIWCNNPARIRNEFLQYPNNQGELSAPNPWAYFWAAQLQHLVGWEMGSLHASSYNILSHLFYNFNPLLTVDPTTPPFKPIYLSNTIFHIQDFSVHPKK